MNIDDLINSLFKDVTTPDANTPGEMVRQSLAGVMPAPQMAPKRTVGAPVMPVARSSLPAAGSSMPAPMAVGAAPQPAAPSTAPMRLNPLGTMARGYQSGGLFGAIGNLFDEPALLERQAQEKARAEQQATATANQTVQALIKAGAPPEIAQASVGNPVLMKQAIDTYIRAPEVVKPTDDMREYEAAKAQGYQGTFMDYQQALRKSGATSINMAGDKAWEVERAKLGAKKLQDLADSANTTAQVVDQMETMQEALDAYNKGSIFGSGNIAPYEVQMRGFLKALGVGNAETLAGGELARSVQNQMALLVRNPESGMGMPGALSDADRTFLVQTMPGLDKSPQGNRIMIAVAKKAAQRKMEIAALAEQYAAQNGGMEGFQAYLKQWADANPMLDDQLKAQIAAAKGVAPVGEPSRVGPNPRAGFLPPSEAPAQPTRRRWNPNTGNVE